MVMISIRRESALLVLATAALWVGANGPVGTAGAAETPVYRLGRLT
jgi:hypothetical protein